MSVRSTLFVRDEAHLQQQLRGVKQVTCVHCGSVGTLNLHDRVYGNHCCDADKRRMRGRRLWCSNRGKRRGCGRTMCIMHAHLLPRHTLDAASADSLMKGLGHGHSIRAAWLKACTPISLDGVYRFVRRLRRGLDRLRTALHARCRPPPSTSPDPLIQTIAHLRDAFPATASPSAAFQLALQRPLMG